MIMTKKEIAEFLKVSTMTIDRQEERGMPVIRVKGMDPRYDSDEIVAWLKNGGDKEG